MILKSKISGVILFGSLLTFALFVVYLLRINLEVFYTAHDRSEFIYGTPFFRTLLSKPFGLMQYVGAWLTQFFCHPAVGATILMIIWTLIFCVGVKAFRLQGQTTFCGNSASALMLLPVACLLTSVVDLGYWIYISTIRGYWFSQSVGYLLMLLLLWAAHSTPRKWHLVWYLLGFCLYPVLGWFAQLFVLCLVVSEKPTWRDFLGVILLVFTASIWHTQFYPNLKFDDVVLAGMPRFVTPSDSAEHLALPFWVLALVTILIPQCGRFLSKPKVSWLVPALCTIAGICFTWSLMFYDRTYINEMRMVRLACDDNWKEVLRIAEENKKLTRTMIFLKNVALMNEGGLLDRSFKLGNDDVNINNPDSLHVTMLDIASPMVYYNYGMMNEAIRLNFEMAIQAGFSPFYLKTLARCAEATGDKELSERYITILRHSPFYENWQPAPVSEKVRKLQSCYPDEISGVERTDSYLVNGISLWSDSDSKVVSEQALFYAMLRCDSRRFWASLRNYVKTHMDEEFPIHAMEAYILYMDKAPEEKRMMLPVDQSVYDRYKRFWATLTSKAKPGMTMKKVSDEMRQDFGDTYWWYNLFGRKYINITGNVSQEVHS